MPYKSEKQRRLMHAKHPEIAARWDAEYGTKVKKSAWADELSKSLIGHGPSGPVYGKATKVGAKKLRSVAMSHRYKKGGRYAQQGRSMAYDTDVSDNLHESRRMVASKLPNAKPNRLEQRPRKDVEVLHAPNYSNAHPVRWGSKKEGRTYIVGGKKMLAKPGIMAHELEHAKKSSWRLAQIQADPIKLAREEARADTVSGTYKINGVRSHTFQNRETARRLDPVKTEAKLKAAKKRSSIFGEAIAAGEHDKARASHAFQETQDKINSSGPKQAYRKTRRKMAVQQTAVGAAVAGGVGGLAHHDNKKAKVRKSMPDVSSVHIVTTMTGPKKLRRIKRKRTVEV